MHLNSNHAVPLAIFAASAFEIETEPTAIVTAYTRRRELTEQFPHRSERARISCGIGWRSSADGCLIDDNRFVYLIKALNRLMSPGAIFGFVKMPEQGTPQNVVDER